MKLMSWEYEGPVSSQLLLGREDVDHLLITCPVSRPGEAFISCCASDWNSSVWKTCGNSSRQCRCWQGNMLEVKFLKCCHMQFAGACARKSWLEYGWWRYHQ